MSMTGIRRRCRGLAFEEIPDMTCDLTGCDPETLLDTLTTGLPTYEKLAVLSDGGIGGSHERAFYYDYRAVRSSASKRMHRAVSCARPAATI